MAKAPEKIVNVEEFERRHNEQVERRGDKDVFFIWIVLMFISVVGSHFILNMTSGSPTGYVTAGQDALGNLYLLVDSFFVLFIAILVGALAYVGITRLDR